MFELELQELTQDEVLANSGKYGKCLYKALPCTRREFLDLIQNWEASWRPNERDQKYYTWIRTLLDQLHYEIRFNDGSLHKVTHVSRRGSRWMSVDIEPRYEFIRLKLEDSFVLSANSFVFRNLREARAFFTASSPYGMEISEAKFRDVKRGRLWGKYPCIFIGTVDIRFEDGSGFTGEHHILVSKALAEYAPIKKSPSELSPNVGEKF